MEKITKLDLTLRFSKKEVPVGQLVLDENDILFKYRESYLLNGHNLSPKKLLMDNSIQVAPPAPFRGLFGVFADSLPDAWGRLVVRRWLAKRGIAIEQLSVLDEMSFLGDKALGALIYRPTREDISAPPSTIDLDAWNETVQGVLEGESEDVIDELFQVAGSPGGARPKIYAGYNPTTDKLIFGHDELPENSQHWIVKFAAKVDALDIANIEMAYYLMAKEAEIDMKESRLLTGKSGNSYFATERFDRLENDRLHMISAAGMFHDDYERSQMDYGTLMHESYELIKSHTVLEETLRRAAFNVFAHNRDDHSKNFAFLMDAEGNWSLAPAYDLTFSSSSHGLHSTSCARNAYDPGTKELMSLAEHFSIRNGEKIISHVKSVVDAWPHFAQLAKVGKESSNTISNRLRRIN